MKNIDQDKIKRFYEIFDNYKVKKEDRFKLVESLTFNEMRFILLEVCNVWNSKDELQKGDEPTK